VKDWAAPTKGTTDLYSACELKHYTPIVRTPVNFFGHQQPVDGISYAGFYAFYNRDYREYMLTKLTQPLDSGKIYHINFWVSLADTAGTAVRELGVVLIDSLFFKPQFTHLEGFDVQPIYNANRTFLKDKKSWVQLSLDYTARGGEDVFILGNFKNNENTDTLFLNDTSAAEFETFDAYYYIDMVCIGERKANGNCDCINGGEPVVISDSNYVDLVEIIPNEAEDNRPKVGDIVILKHIYFDFDKAILKSTSEPELQKLYNLLVQYSTLKIIINGHTDNKGSDNYNLLLSESRALAVYAWLVQKGIDSQRLDFKGFGEQRPLETNQTENGRQTNRRVEFEVIEQ